MRRFVRWGRFIALVACLIFVAAGVVQAAPAPPPTLRLRRSVAEITVPRFGTSVFIDGGTYVESVNGAFELRARRADYDEPIVVEQAIASPGGKVSYRSLPELSPSSFARALEDFFHLRLSTDAGDVVFKGDTGFCPNGYDRVRVDGSGPARLLYPDGCFTNQWTLGATWGIEQGWASGATDEFSFEGPDGHYQLRVSVNEPYRTLFGVDPSATTVGVTIKTDPCCTGGSGSARSSSAPVDHGSAIRPRSSAVGAPYAAPTGATIPKADALPDLIATPAWRMQTENQATGDFLDFAAMVWDRGPSPLVVEGFRPTDADYMNAYQYFYKDGQRVGEAPVGTFEFDARPGHEHWHFEDFARYVLTDSSKTTVVRSQKEAFCLAATDAMDLSVPGAAWRPFDTDPSSSCGTPTSIWIREVLNAGWGDTYTQSLPGQSFDITGLANGTYYVKIIANPRHVLYESTLANNVSYRRVVLGGVPGARTVRVSPYHGLHTERPCFPFCDIG